MLQQVSVFVENRPGRMTDIMKVISDAQLDIHGISVADSADFGVCRLVLSDPVAGRKSLQQAGFIVKVSEVLALDISDESGSLYQAMDKISVQQINVDYIYAFGTKLSGHAMIIMKTDDDHRASAILKENGYTLLDQEQMEDRLHA